MGEEMSKKKNKNEEIFVINFKTYKEGTDISAFSLAKKCEAISKKTKKEIILCLQAVDLQYAKSLHIQTFAQHIDPFEYGTHTGFVLPSVVKQKGAVGTLLNHSEHKLRFKYLKECIIAAKKEKLTIIACADTPKEAAKIATLCPDYIAIEPPELIGGKISVATAEPEIITKTIKAVHKTKEGKQIKILCGAGVHERRDVEIALQLGCSGVLIASGVVLAKDQMKELEELMR